MAPPSSRRYRRRRASRRNQKTSPPAPVPAEEIPESEIGLLVAQLKQASIAYQLERGKAVATSEARLPTDIQNRREVFRRISVDILGPLPETKEGNTHMLLVVCLFTRWTELWPIRDCKAATVTSALVERVLSTFGMPEVIYTDGHDAFESEHFRKRLKDMGSLITSLPPMYPSGPGEVERRDRKILDKLESLVQEKQKMWDKNIKVYQYIYNTTVNSLTQIAPHTLMFPPVSVLSEFLEDASDYDSSDSAEKEEWDYESFRRWVDKRDLAWDKKEKAEQAKDGDE